MLCASSREIGARARSCEIERDRARWPLNSSAEEERRLFDNRLAPHKLLHRHTWVRGEGDGMRVGDDGMMG